MSSPIPSSPPPALPVTPIDNSDFTPGVAASNPVDTILTASPNDISISAFFSVQSDSKINLSQTLHGIEFSDATLSSRYALDALSQLDAMITKYNSLRLQYEASQVNTAQADLATNGLNTTAASSNTSISQTQQDAATYNAAVDQYNTEAANFNAQEQAGFPDQATRDAAITQYNNAVATYNAAAAAYNSSVGNANIAITNYNAQIDQYNSTVLVQTNAQIDAENITRASQGLDPLPHQDPLPDQPLIPTVATMSPLPYADPSGPVPTLTQTPIPSLIPIRKLPGSLAFFADFLTPLYFPFALPALFYLTSLHRIFERLLSHKAIPDDHLQGITAPDAFAHPRAADSVPTTGVGGVGMGTLALGLDNPELASILAKGLVDQVFAQLNLTTSPPLQERLTPFVLTLFLQSSVAGALPAVQTFLGADLSQVENQTGAGRAASSLGTVAAVLGLLRGNALQASIQKIIQTTQGLESLNNDDKDRLRTGLQAVLSTALLKLALGSLVHETQTPGLLKVLDAGAILGVPQNANSRFGVVTTSLDDLKASFGQEAVSTLLGQFLAAQLSKTPTINPAQASGLAQQIATNVTNEPTPTSTTALKNLIQSALGSQSNPDLLQQISGQISLFALAGAARSELLQNLISSGGPAHAEDLTNQAIIRLFGFSPSFNEGEIIQRPTEEATALPASSSLAENARNLHAIDTKKSGLLVADNFNTSRAHEDIHSLDAFLREVIDPGQILVGLMYQGDKGHAFERGQIDIKVA